MQMKPGHGALSALGPAAREMVARRMTLRDADRPAESRRAAAEWLREHGTAPDAAEAASFLAGRRHA